MASDVFDSLKKFGLTPYEIKAYKSLLLYGPLTPMEAVNLAGIPQPRIYDVIRKLMDKGLIEMSPDRKKLYRAKEVQTTLGRKIEEMSSDVDEISKEIAKTASGVREQTPYLWLIQSESKVRSEIRRLIDSTNDELILSLKTESLKAVRKNIIGAIERGVTVAMVVFPDTDEKVVSNFEGAFVKRRKGFASEVAISDRNNALIRIDNGSLSNNYAISVDEDEIIHITSYYFYHTIWGPSEFVIMRDDNYPMRLRTSWLACDIIAHNITPEKKLRAKVTGRYKGKSIKINGTICKSEVETGFRHSFYIQSKAKEYSVGGKSARIEDVAMEILEIVGESTT